MAEWRSAACLSLFLWVKERAKPRMQHCGHEAYSSYFHLQIIFLQSLTLFSIFLDTKIQFTSAHTSCVYEGRTHTHTLTVGSCSDTRWQKLKVVLKKQSFTILHSAVSPPTVSYAVSLSVGGCLQCGDKTAASLICGWHKPTKKAIRFIFTIILPLSLLYPSISSPFNSPLLSTHE